MTGSQQANDFQRAVSLVEETVRALGIDPAQCRAQFPGAGEAFSLRRGSASMLVLLHEGKGTESGALRIVAPVVLLPQDAAKEHALFRRLLQANAREIVGAAFAVIDGQAVIVAERSLADLDASEVSHLIRSVGKQADRFDDALAQEFGVQRVSDRK